MGNMAPAAQLVEWLLAGGAWSGGCGAGGFCKGLGLGVALVVYFKRGVKIVLASADPRTLDTS